jgi:hypothetical protein
MKTSIKVPPCPCQQKNFVIKHYGMEAYMIMAAKPGNHSPKPAHNHPKKKL